MNPLREQLALLNRIPYTPTVAIKRAAIVRELSKPPRRQLTNSTKLLSFLRSTLGFHHA